MSAAPRVVEHVTCLGCGCTCDDIRITLKGDRISTAANACDLGERWFGDGRRPAGIQLDGAASALDPALDRSAELLRAARNGMVYLSADLSCEAMKAAIALADRLGARLDSLVSDTAARGILAAQARGRAGATLGEVLNRADTVVFWGVDPEQRYPRFISRYAVEREGLFTPKGRASRTVVAVDVGSCRGPAVANHRIAIDPAMEVSALALLRGMAQGRTVGPLPAGTGALAELAKILTQGKYVALVYDGEPSELAPDAGRAEGLISLAQALNGPTRAALVALRAGGNRSGAEAVMTWQTGYPFAIDFSRGHPRYQPRDSAARLLGESGVDVLLVAGGVAALPDTVAGGLGRVKTIIIGPEATAAKTTPAVAIDTGVAGIHEDGTAFRMDDVPVPLTRVLEGALSARSVLEALLERVRRGG